VNSWVVDANAAIAMRTIRVRVSIAFNRLPQIPEATVTEVVIAARDVEVTPASARLWRRAAIGRCRPWSHAAFCQVTILAGVVRVQSELCLSLGFIPMERAVPRWPHEGELLGGLLRHARRR
jgi:hypothetical protein